MWIKSTICLAAIGLTVVATNYELDRREERKHWVKLKGFSGAVGRGDIKSMKPVSLSVWRFRSDKQPETTHERLEFAIPAAYMIDRSNLAGGRQKEIYLYVHWPTGEPDGFHKDIEQYNRHSAGWPQEKYFVQLTSWGIPVVNLPDQKREDLLKAFLQTQGSFGSDPNLYRGKYCGWEAYDEINTGKNTLEIQNKESGVTSELYFDTIDPKKWRRRVKCGPNMRVCTLYTDYQRFALAIKFSPLNICKARDFEAQTKAMLDRFLIKHHPPTRMWSEKQDPEILEPYENSNKWTRNNLNNANIREAAR
jgi:hypothetical protein